MEEDRQEIQARLSHLENICILLEEARVYGRNMGSPEGDRLEGQIRTSSGRSTDRYTTCGLLYLRGFGCWP